jgi:hypothetical protein
MHAAALDGRAKNLIGRGLQALMLVGDDQQDIAASAHSERYASPTAPRPASATSVPWGQNTMCRIKS